MNDLEILALKQIKKIVDKVRYDVIGIHGDMITKKEEITKDRILALHGEMGDISSWSEAIIENNEDK